MRRFFSTFMAAAMCAALGSIVTPAPASAASMMTMTTKCPAGQTAVKGYTKADGTKVAAYCRTSSMSSGMSSSMMMKCPTGEMMVKGYTKADGTKVAGYCRKK